VLPQTWGVILGRALIEPVWFFVADWLAIILVSKGIKIEGSMAAFSIPFVAADMGSLFGGALSGWLIARGWSVGSARKIPMIVFSFGMTALIPIGYVSNVWAVTALFAIATFSYAVWITMNIVLPSDLFPSDSVATVTGMSGTGGGVATVLSTCLIGYVSDRYSFKSLLSVAGICPLIATGVSLLLLRNRIDNAAMVQRT
jgi:ACS family hexuronate transporter-like MFS transporter